MVRDIPCPSVAWPTVQTGLSCGEHDIRQVNRSRQLGNLARRRDASRVNQGIIRENGIVPVPARELSFTASGAQIYWRGDVASRRDHRYQRKMHSLSLQLGGWWTQIVRLLMMQHKLLLHRVLVVATNAPISAADGDQILWLWLTTSD